MFKSQFPLWLVAMGLLTGKAAAQTTAQVSFASLTQEYTGTTRLPTVITTPGGLATRVSVTPRVSQTVYKTMPQVMDLSYGGSPLSGNVNKALGDTVTIGGSNRVLESVETILVSWAKAADYPALAAENPKGFYHPVTALVYNRDGNTFTLIGQRTESIFVPWRPLTLSDGSAYPYNGLAFKARFNFPPMAATPLSPTIGVLIAYNTQSNGFNPIGTAGPYNSLNIALGSPVPSVGVNSDTQRMLRYETGLVDSTAFSGQAPYLEVRAFPASPPSGTPVESGDYYVTATIDQAGYQGTASTNFTITPLAAQITLGNLKQGADGTPKPVGVTTNPAGLAHSVLYNGQATVPTTMGDYVVTARITAPNRTGTATAKMTLGRTFATWIQPWITNGSIPAGSAGPLDDPDHDGISNLLEYSAGSNPAMSDVLARLAILDQGSSVTLRYKKQTSILDLGYKIQTSTSLESGSWSDLPGTPAPISTVDGIQTMQQLHTKVPENPKHFYRLHVTQNPL